MARLPQTALVGIIVARSLWRARGVDRDGVAVIDYRHIAATIASISGAPSRQRRRCRSAGARASGYRSPAT